MSVVEVITGRCLVDFGDGIAAVVRLPREAELARRGFDLVQACADEVAQIGRLPGGHDQHAHVSFGTGPCDLYAWAFSAGAYRTDALNLADLGFSKEFHLDLSFVLQRGDDAESGAGRESAPDEAGGGGAGQ